jgi:hypothetical protein
VARFAGDAVKTHESLNQETRNFAYESLEWARIEPLSMSEVPGEGEQLLDVTLLYSYYTPDESCFSDKNLNRQDAKAPRWSLENDASWRLGVLAVQAFGCPASPR